MTPLLCSWCDDVATTLLIARLDKSHRDYACNAHAAEYGDGFEVSAPVATAVQA